MRNWLLLSCIAGLTGCSAMESASTSSVRGGDDSSGKSGSETTAVAPGPSDSTSGGYSSSGSSSGGGSPDAGIVPGTLTAGAWDDNLNFDFFLAYQQTMEQAQTTGIPLVPRADRVVIRVVDGGGMPLAGANVEVRHGTSHLFSAPTGAEGRVLVFPTWQGAPGEALDVTATYHGAVARGTVAAGQKEIELRLASAIGGAVGQLDVALVVDTTGSMMDEIDYLKVEFENIVATVQQRFPSLSQRWGLVIYRDDGDAYVVRSTPFTDDLTAFKAQLAQVQADGGGDYEEVPDRALNAAMLLDWRSEATARVIFHVADAPQHPGTESNLLAAIGKARDAGVHIYSIAASGVDERTEFTMRSSAQLTGGRYLFLTDDSGVGGEHKEPTLPCYFVTKLSQAMVRMVTIELVGDWVEPAVDEIIRTGGDPTDRACTLTDGQVVVAF